uniref:Uncharacterized protein n=1 Tax=Anopheles minimus TaxID=112268 RepID=A0A182WN67_9DIPT
TNFHPFTYYGFGAKFPSAAYAVGSQDDPNTTEMAAMIEHRPPYRNVTRKVIVVPTLLHYAVQL